MHINFHFFFFLENYTQAIVHKLLRWSIVSQYYFFFTTLKCLFYDLVSNVNYLLVRLESVSLILWSLCFHESCFINYAVNVNHQQSSWLRQIVHTLHYLTLVRCHHIHTFSPSLDIIYSYANKWIRNINSYFPFNFFLGCAWMLIPQYKIKKIKKSPSKHNVQTVPHYTRHILFIELTQSLIFVLLLVCVNICMSKICHLGNCFHAMHLPWHHTFQLLLKKKMINNSGEWWFTWNIFFYIL